MTATTTKKNPLPLDWTQLGKKSNRRAKQQQRDSDNNVFEWRCCDRRGCRHVQSQLSNSNSNKRPAAGTQILRRQFTGKALFCLHESDPQWFQGYFFPSNSPPLANGSTASISTTSFAQSSKPWRLLVTRQEIDECLECSEGGYRVVTVQVKYDEAKSFNAINSQHRQSSMSQQQQQQQRSVLFPDIEWTGGDMMDWNSPQVRFRAQRLSTGATAEPLAEQVFGGLLRQARQGLDPDTPIAELFPELAIVAGNLQLMMPVDRDDDKELYELMMKDM